MLNHTASFHEISVELKTYLKSSSLQTDRFHDIAIFYDIDNNSLIVGDYNGNQKPTEVHWTTKLDTNHVDFLLKHYNRYAILSCASRTEQILKTNKNGFSVFDFRVNRDISYLHGILTLILLDLAQYELEDERNSLQLEVEDYEYEDEVLACHAEIN